jgi:hypothetical protein
VAGELAELARVLVAHRLADRGGSHPVSAGA